MTIREITGKMKMAAPMLAAASCEQRNQALAAVREALLAKREAVFEANRKDLELAQQTDVPAPVRKRLRFDEGKLQDVCAGIDQLISLPDPVGRVLLDRQLDEGLNLRKVSCPIGVIGVIFEARPDALVQISSLCIKSGNCAILKGGKETAQTNKVLFELIRSAAAGAGLPDYSLVQAYDHSQIDELLECYENVDLLIPRGSNRFVRYIMDHTRIPVMGHAEGVCHVYLDDDADMQMALDVITDAKKQYPAACNAAETLLVRRGIAQKVIPLIEERLIKEGIRIRADQETARLFSEGAVERLIDEEDYHTEYSDVILSVRQVEDVKEAADQINRYGSHHTDAILTSDDAAAEYFMQMVDSAGVYRNCSTRFADGFRYGFGAEVGISTGKLHARGPVGLDGLVTYKYKIIGSGHIVGDYASGRKQFHFHDK